MTKNGKIFICATPIGNLGDCSIRLIDILKDVDLIYAEDTRVTNKLLQHFSIKKSLKRLDENIMDNVVDDVINQAKEGKSIAYMTDAGMPGVSDPGLRLVSAAKEAHVDVEVLPGPSAAITAYVASGFNNSKFYFGGFFPRKKKEQSETLENLKKLDAVLIFYESPKRLLASLDAIANTMPESIISVCRELTKLHEEVAVGSPKKLLEDFLNRESIKGEIVICIHNPERADKPNKDVENLTNFLLEKGLKTNDIAKALTSTFDISKKEAYEIALKQK